MTATVAQALTRARTQSRYGPAFGVNLCKQKCRELYDVPSDGSPSAAVAWTRTKYRHQFHEQAPPIGALIWWTGGAGGFGHVAVYAGQGNVWSTDILRPGYFDHVPLTRIASSWPNLTLVGWSEDIDGVRVVTAPAPREDIDMANLTPEQREQLVADIADRTAKRVLYELGVPDPGLGKNRTVRGALTELLRTVQSIKTKVGAR